MEVTPEVEVQERQREEHVGPKQLSFSVYKRRVVSLGLHAAPYQFPAFLMTGLLPWYEVGGRAVES